MAIESNVVIGEYRPKISDTVPDDFHGVLEGSFVSLGPTKLTKLKNSCPQLGNFFKGNKPTDQSKIVQISLL